MCLLIVLSRSHPEYRLVVAANRDELLDRPAQAMAVLREGRPRVLGGRDDVAGGTWLAVNESGVVAGITNSPATEGRDPTKRSRGELTLALATHVSASAAVEEFAETFRPLEYNPAWLLVGDRDDLFFVDMTHGTRPVIESLPAGMHFLENRPLGAPSAKIDNVRRLLAGVEDMAGEDLRSHLRRVLSDHEVPPAVLVGAPDDAERRRAPAAAACVHAENYGTRWSGIVTVGPSRRVPPDFCYTDGPPCAAGVVDAMPLWVSRG